MRRRAFIAGFCERGGGAKDSLGAAISGAGNRVP